MNRLVNPFRYVAGVRALTAGLALIAAASCWLHALGLCQDSYLHFSPAPDGFTVWHVAALQIGMWLAPALALYGCGRMLSPSRIRLVDVLGTTALAQAPILLLLVPLSIGPLRALVDRTAAELLAGTLPTPGQTAALAAMGIWSLAALALFYARNYQAYALSCNLKGWRAALSYAAVAALMTVITQYLPL